MKRIVKGDYLDLFPVEKDDVVLDVGATRGDFAQAISSYSPSRCICIEASPYFHQELSRNLKILNQARDKEVFVMVDRALTSIYDDKFVDCRGDKMWSDSCPYIDEANIADNPSSHKYVSRTISLSTLFSSLSLDRVDFMKMDIEGSEIDIFLNDECFDIISKKVKKITAELHPIYLREVKKLSDEDNQKVINKIVENFESAGFDVTLAKYTDGKRRVFTDDLSNDTWLVDIWAQKT
jgi:FkbM family methyltransferase